MNEPEFGRVDYTLAGLDESDLGDDPMSFFARWYTEARDEAAGIGEPNAMVLSTVAQSGAQSGAQPGAQSGAVSSRTVLLKGLEAEGEPGFVLYTNLRSRKAIELAARPRCSLLFGWYALQRQVRVEGVAREVARATSEAYFATRPRDSQLGAWASVEPVAQSGVVADRAALEAAYHVMEQRFDGTEVPCPPTWGGYVVVPEAVEFWQGRHGRVHDRLRYRRDGGGWVSERLAP